MVKQLPSTWFVRHSGKVMVWLERGQRRMEMKNLAGNAQLIAHRRRPPVFHCEPRLVDA